MLRSIKKRLKNVSRTPSDGVDSESSLSFRTATSNPSSLVSDSQHSSKKKTPRRRSLEKTTKTTTPNDSLTAFDSCVHAADALGASSGMLETSPHTILTSARKDPVTGLVDCSVLVSPDGNLLLLAQQADNHNDDDNGDSPETSEQQDNSLFSQLIAQGKEDYDAAMFFGNDLVPDKTLNGFSAKGWSIPATSHALYQAQAGMQHFHHTVQSVLQSRQEQASAVQRAYCSSALDSTPMSSWRTKKDSNRNIKSRTNSWELIDPRAGDFEQTAERVGPFQATSSTLYEAVTSMQDYQTNMASSALQRWNTSTTTEGFWPELQTATQQMSQRVVRRQDALKETSRKVRLMEDRLVQLKHAADKSWEAVYQAEAKATKKMEQILKDRSREREKQRLAQLREQEKKQEVALGTTSEEIWNIVSQVAESMEDGSFEPMDLPSAPFKAPTDKSKQNTGEAALPKNENAPSSPRSDGGEPNSPERSENLPPVSREAIEHEVGLPELRSAAMKADDDVADAAQELLQILSNLDTTRRSARAAAETCLVAAGNAQVKSLKTWIELERASLEERLAGLTAVEEAVDKVDVRSDLDKYITADKKIRGGSSHLGDDDDGGVASALATLSSHVDGIMGHETTTRKNSGADVFHDDGTTLEGLEKSLQKLFQEIAELQDNAPESAETSRIRAEFEESVDSLCKAALDDSPLATARRSAFCYALNAKRSNAEIQTRLQFDGLCRVFSAILKGCDSEKGGVSNAKMCIMLAQTFYLVDNTNGSADDDPTTHPVQSPVRISRSQRIYIRSRLMDDPIWSKDDFWDEALDQQLSEALTQSGVMSNFEKQKVTISRKIRQHSEWAQTRKTKWHDLNSIERVEAASQVHAVVFAQLGALAHSMIEFGCGLERACAFVRRMSIRHQLPSSHRIMLLKHLVVRDDTNHQDVNG